MATGTRLRHLKGPNLAKLEDLIENLPHKSEIVGVNLVGRVWHVHFTIPDTAFGDGPNMSTFEVSQGTKTLE
jgi:hypothetical protein